MQGKREASAFLDFNFKKLSGPNIEDINGGIEA
jgi:hypothetical protein